MQTIQTQKGGVVFAYIITSDYYYQQIEYWIRVRNVSSKAWWLLTTLEVYNDWK